MKNLQGATTWLYKPVSNTVLAYYRIVFGGILFWEVLRYFKNGWIEEYWVKPDTWFGYVPFDWLEPWGGGWMMAHMLVLGVLAIFIMIGLWYRYVSVIFFFGFTYVFLLDKSNYLNHFYLISLMSGVNMFLPLNRKMSLDAKIDPTLRADFCPNWNVRIIQFLLGVAYFFGGIAKLNADWLNAQPISMWISYQQDFPLVGQFFGEKWAGYFFAYSGLLLDLFIVPVLLWRRTFWIGFIGITAFHVWNHFLWSIGIFPWFMIFATLTFMPPEKFDKLFRQKPAGPPPVFTPKKWQLRWIVLFVAIQMLLPFRHLLMKGNVHWNEAGHRFSWHMKLRSKSGRGNMYVVDRNTQRKTPVQFRDFLSPRQERKMKTHPDMIVQFAHYLEDKWRENGVSVAVYADIQCSLNGRPFQQFTKTDVDLTKVSPTAAYYKIVVPLTTPLVMQ